MKNLSKMTNRQLLNRLEALLTSKGDINEYLNHKNEVLRRMGETNVPPAGARTDL